MIKMTTSTWTTEMHILHYSTSIIVMQSIFASLIPLFSILGILSEDTATLELIFPFWEAFNCSPYLV